MCFVARECGAGILFVVFGFRVFDARSDLAEKSVRTVADSLPIAGAADLCLDVCSYWLI